MRLESRVTTLELAQAAEDVRRESLCLQDCQRRLDAAKRRREEASRNQERLNVELTRIDRTLGRLGLPGRQLLITGNRKNLEVRRRQLLQMLRAAPG